MGYYIDNDSSGAVLPRFDKAEHLIQYEGAIVLENPTEFVEGMVCVVENGMFDAAAYAYSESEFKCFYDLADVRKKTWLRLDPEKAKQLSGFWVIICV